MVILQKEGIEASSQTLSLIQHNNNWRNLSFPRIIHFKTPIRNLGSQTAVDRRKTVALFLLRIWIKRLAKKQVHSNQRRSFFINHSDCIETTVELTSRFRNLHCEFLYVHIYIQWNSFLSYTGQDSVETVWVKVSWAYFMSIEFILPHINVLCHLKCLACSIYNRSL